VRVAIPEGRRVARVRRLWAGTALVPQVEGRWLTAEFGGLGEYEALAVDLEAPGGASSAPGEP
jgi:hypothetical protein